MTHSTSQLEPQITRPTHFPVSPEEAARREQRAARGHGGSGANGGTVMNDVRDELADKIREFEKETNRRMEEKQRRVEELEEEVKKGGERVGGLEKELEEVRAENRRLQRMVEAVLKGRDERREGGGEGEEEGGARSGKGGDESAEPDTLPAAPTLPQLTTPAPTGIPSHQPPIPLELLSTLENLSRAVARDRDTPAQGTDGNDKFTLRFDGLSDEPAKKFVTELGRFVRGHPTTYTTAGADERLQYLISGALDGTARSWYDKLAGAMGPQLTLERFEELFLERYRDKQEVTRARKRLPTIRQRGRPYRTFKDEFLECAEVANLSDADTAALMRAGTDDFLHDAAMVQPGAMESLRGWIGVCTHLVELWAENAPRNPMFKASGTKPVAFAAARTEAEGSTLRSEQEVGRGGGGGPAGVGRPKYTGPPCGWCLRLGRDAWRAATHAESQCGEKRKAQWEEGKGKDKEESEAGNGSGRGQ